MADSQGKCEKKTSWKLHRPDWMSDKHGQQKKSKPKNRKNTSKNNSDDKMLQKTSLNTNLREEEIDYLQRKQDKCEETGLGQREAVDNPGDWISKREIS